MSRTYYSEDKTEHSYDYNKQVWIVNGVYMDCGHRPEMKCGCYGRKHAGEKAEITEHCH